MQVAFCTVWNEMKPDLYLFADYLMRSVREAMPGIEVVQLTDDHSPAVQGVDHVRRLPLDSFKTFDETYIDLRLRHYAKLTDSMLLLDTDCVVQGDCSRIFEDGPVFHVAFADRKWPHMARDIALEQVAPFQTGVAFSRTPVFWSAVHQRWLADELTRSASKTRWMSDQYAVGHVVGSGSYRVRTLAGMVFNYIPGADGTVPAGTVIVHYKGVTRHKQLRDRIERRSLTDVVLAGAQAAAAAPTNPQPLAVGDMSINGRVIDTPLRVFIGYDHRQPVAFHVAAHSVVTRAVGPVAIIRLQLDQLPINRKGLTEFTYSRYLVPFLCGYRGEALFLDADVLCRGNIFELALKIDPEAAVSVVPHDVVFERPSVMWFNNEKCQVLTPDAIDGQKIDLFSMKWASKVGELPKEWNHLVGYGTTNPLAKLVHFTKGVPVWPQTFNDEHAEEWRAERDALMATCPFEELMAHSVHQYKKRS